MDSRRAGRGCFEGWYFKQQSGEDTVALIPALHAGDEGEARASLQIITPRQALCVEYPASAYGAGRTGLPLRLGNCRFSPSGCRLDVRSASCQLQGRLRFGPLTPPAYDMMGPFALVPGMECRHTVRSLTHRVDGELTVNGRRFLFDGGRGYLEGDRGRSFPRRYLWTHCGWEENSLMLSAAEIPIGPFGFVGCTGFVYWKGREHRIATYCGAKLLTVGEREIRLRQGRLTLTIRMLRDGGRLLRAPCRGRMVRRIHESVACRVRYACSLDGRVLFDFISDQASFENNWRGDSV